MDAFRGPTVHQAAADTIRKCRAKIALLQDEIKYAEARLNNSRYAFMLEAERIATERDGLQRTPLPS